MNWKPQHSAKALCCLPSNPITLSLKEIVSNMVQMADGWLHACLLFQNNAPGFLTPILEWQYHRVHISQNHHCEIVVRGPDQKLGSIPHTKHN